MIVNPASIGEVLICHFCIFYSRRLAVRHCLLASLLYAPMPRPLASSPERPIPMV
jgi:hypothetical protein